MGSSEMKRSVLGSFSLGFLGVIFLLSAEGNEVADCCLQVQGEVQLSLGGLDAAVTQQVTDLSEGNPGVIT